MMQCFNNFLRLDISAISGLSVKNNLFLLLKNEQIRHLSFIAALALSNLVETRSMKPFLTVMALMLMLSSCTNYQYLTLDAERTTKNEKKEIVWENDSVRLVYNFNGRWGQMNIMAYNKSNEPVFINWKKSALVIGDRPISLYDPNVKVSGESVDFKINHSVTYGYTEANFTLPEGSDFMPPKTYITKQNISLLQTFPVLPALSNALPVQKTTYEGNKVTYRTTRYDQASSPFTFRLYLTFGFGKENKEFSVDHLFYVSEAIQSENGPYLMFMGDDGDKFYWRVSE
jgi:hypothetical protein